MKAARHKTVLSRRGKTRYSYQEEAEQAGRPARGRGSGHLMATGTGKTFTAFKTIKRLFEDGKIDNVVLNTKKRLLDQWYDDMLVGRMPDGTKCALWMEYDIWHVSGQKDMAEFRQMARYLSVLHHLRLPSGLPRRSSVHNTDLSRTLLVIDEVHNVGAEQMRGKLSLKTEVRKRRTRPCTSTTVYLRNTVGSVIGSA